MRDNLLKNNIIKADKAVIDIGSNTTKILSVHYTAKEIVVEDAEIVSSGGMNVFNFVKFANRINSVLKGKKRKDIILSLPSNMTESKIVSVKNKNGKEESNENTRIISTSGIIFKSKNSIFIWGRCSICRNSRIIT